MTQEEYSQLDSDFAHCAGANCKETDQCLHHTVYGMLSENHNPTYMVVNSAIITGRQLCPLFIPDRHERYAWGISHIFDNVRAADLRAAKHGVKACFGSSTMSRSSSAPLPKRSSRPSGKFLPNWATTAQPSSSTDMKNAIPR